MAVSSEDDYAEQFLMKFPSYDIYKKLSNNKDVSNKYDTYCTNVKRLLPSNPKIYELCRIYARNLKEISTILDGTINNTDRCRYLNFWKNDQINKNCNTSNNVCNIQRIRSNFITVANRIHEESSIDRCFYTLRRDISLDLWKKWKDLYDFIINKHMFQERINSDPHLCKLYRQYIEYIKEVYRKYDAECCETDNGDCPDHLKFKEWCKKEHIITQLECNPSEDVSEPSGENSQDIESTLKGTYEGGPQMEALDEGVERAVFEAQTGEPRDNLLYSEHDTGPFASETTEEPANGNETNPVGTIVGTSLGFFLPLITIYRFTPLGSWINTKIFRKDRLMENMIRNERELLLNNSGNGEMNFDNTRYHIMYNSANNE